MDELKKLLDSEAGKTLRDFIEDRFKLAKDIRNIPDRSSAEDQAIEVKAQRRYVNLLVDMLSEIMSIQESTISVKDPKDNFHPYDEKGEKVQEVQ